MWAVPSRSFQFSVFSVQCSVCRRVGSDLGCTKSGKNGPFCGSDIDPVFVPATEGICHCFMSGGVQPLRKQPVPLGALVVKSSLRIRRIRVIRGYCFSAISGSGLLRPFRAFCGELTTDPGRRCALPRAILWLAFQAGRSLSTTSMVSRCRSLRTFRALAAYARQWHPATSRFHTTGKSFGQERTARRSVPATIARNSNRVPLPLVS